MFARDLDLDLDQFLILPLGSWLGVSFFQDKVFKFVGLRRRYAL